MYVYIYIISYTLKAVITIYLPKINEPESDQQ